MPCLPIKPLFVAATLLALAHAPRAHAEVGPEFAVCRTGGEQADLTAIGDGAGGWYVAWADYSADPNGNVHVIRLDPNGDVAAPWPPGGKPLATSGTPERSPKLVLDGAGGVVCVWPNPLSAHVQTLYASRLSPSGAFVWGVLPIAVTPLPSEYLRDPSSVSVVGDGGGGVWVSYMAIHNANGVESLPHAHHVAGDGLLDIERELSPNVCVLPTTTGLVRDAQGRVLVVWTELLLNSGDADLRVQRLRANGSRDPGFPPEGLPIGGSLDNQYAPVMVSDGADGAFAAWLDQVGGDPEVTLLHIGGDGRAATGWPAKGMALTSDQAGQEAPVLAPLPGGNVLACWIDRRSGGADVYATGVRGDGTLAEGWITGGKPVAITNTLEESSQSIAMLTDGSVYTAWDAAPAGAQHDVYAARISPLGGVTPYPASLAISARAKVDEARPVVAVNPSGAAAVFWIDRRSGEADLYGRLVQIPFVLDAPSAAVTFALDGVRPSPARASQARLAFTLPDDAPATLTLHDIAGRRVWSREVGSLGRGHHELGIGATLRAGLYFARLERGGAWRSTRVVVE